ncbi:NADH:ubiquinone oxidoreductase [uncultured Roseovarius sp.]|uniref:NADH:ubiquinone oxidoreductase n=1 Tax=uncultured Roseovarius sp. TaxID=293344 RepID=UPI000C5FF7FF|nr:NADH:ubiquinone oxidoreductase [Roseovarius sp.]MBD13352.1 NADH:ubiquinone oxidoreductase [Roseovarius sp.]|tara:strand:+ start:504 stop:1178 length:675 start_codon:yes stop_codon:yes gene_type:complete
MSDTSKLSTCQIISWGLALLSGVLVVWSTAEAVGVFAALLLGVAFAVFFGLVISGLVCTGYRPDDRGIEARDVEATLRGVTGITGYKAPDVEDEAPAPVSSPVATPAQSAAVVAETKTEAASEGAEMGTKPAALSAPRGGAADDLKQIKGVGPKLEELCNELGFYHFDQIAGWTAAEVAWVDENLKGFKGRVSRDNWVEQAKTLAAGGETEFSKRVASGGVYEE